MKKNIFKLCLSGISIALVIVLSTYCQLPLGPSIRLDIGYAVVVIAAMYLGASYGCVIAFLARIINDLIFSGSISFWWAIGSAFFGLAVGLMYHFVNKLSNKKLQAVLVSISLIIISFVSFAGIVPVVASMVGLEYNFMLGIGILASIADAIVSVVLGYPAYEVLKLKVLKKID